MDSFSKNRYLAGTIGILILLNLLALGMLWVTLFRGPGGPPPEAPFAGRSDRPPRDRSLAILRRELQLTPQQTEQVRVLQRQHFSRIDALQQEIHAARLRLSAAIFEGEPAVSEVQALAAQVGEKSSQIEVERVQHFRRIEALCDPGQKEQLRRVVEQILTTTGPGRPDRDGLDRGPNPRGRGPRPLQGPDANRPGGRMRRRGSPGS